VELTNAERLHRRIVNLIFVSRAFLLLCRMGGIAESYTIYLRSLNIWEGEGSCTWKPPTARPKVASHWTQLLGNVHSMLQAIFTPEYT
jgi:hypothetical protein